MEIARYVSFTALASLMTSDKKTKLDRLVEKQT